MTYYTDTTAQLGLGGEIISQYFPSKAAQKCCDWAAELNMSWIWVLQLYCRHDYWYFDIV